MTDPDRAGDATGSEVKPELPQPPGMPRWVKITLLAVGLLVLILIATAVFAGGGSHRPGMHGGLAGVPSSSGTNASYATA